MYVLNRIPSIVYVICESYITSGQLAAKQQLSDAVTVICQLSKQRGRLTNALTHGHAHSTVDRHQKHSCPSINRVHRQHAKY